jgi:phosphohistidine phosphatase
VKTLYIVRHAKSSWSDPLADDFDRPLNERGKRDAPKMGKRLKEKGILPTLMITSPAKRARSTARKIAEEIKYKKDDIKEERKLYHAEEDVILEVIRKIKDKHNVVMLFGHNPGLTNFVNSLQDKEFDIDNVPTCGIVAFQLKIDSWNDISWGKGTMVFFDYPKRLSE